MAKTAIINSYNRRGAEMESAHQGPPRQRERDRQFVPLPEHWLVLGILVIFVGSGILGWLGVLQ